MLAGIWLNKIKKKTRNMCEQEEGKKSHSTIEDT